MDVNGESFKEGRVNLGLQTTDFAVVQRAQQRAESPELARQALGELCVTYLYPVYALIRRQRASADTAEDLTQAFFADLLARGIDTYDRERIRFRPWLMGAVRNFLRRNRTYWRAKKRDYRRTVYFDGLQAEQRYQLEPRHTANPERLFDRSFGYELIESALRTTREQYAARDGLLRFDTLQAFISMGEFEDTEYAPAAAALGITVEAARRAAHDLRVRFQTNLRATVRRIVPRDEFVRDELKYLYDSMRLPEQSWCQFQVRDAPAEHESKSQNDRQLPPHRSDAH